MPQPQDNLLVVFDRAGWPHASLAEGASSEAIRPIEHGATLGAIGHVVVAPRP